MISLLVKNVMIKDIVTFSKNDLVKNIAKMMAEREISCVVIVEKRKPIGILTERDIIKKIVSKNIVVDDIKAKDVMSTNLLTIKEDENIFKVAKLMEDKHIRRLPVVKDNTLVGLVTETDLIKAMTKTATELNKQLVKFIVNT